LTTPGPCACAALFSSTYKQEILAMTNFLDMRCPKCGDAHSIDIQATVWIRVCRDGTDADASRCGDHEYSPESTASCDACGHWGTVSAFTPDTPPLV
jgi:ribosomal protein S27E